MIKPPQSWLSRRHRRHRLSWCPWKPPPPALPRPEKNEYIVNVKLLTHHHQSHLSVVLPFAAVGVSLVFTWAVWHLLFLETFCVMILLMESISYKWWICICFLLSFVFLASQDALEVVLVSQSVSQSVTLRTELTDVTLVSEDTYWRLYWWDSGN